jgi:hypothetical protein
MRRFDFANEYEIGRPLNAFDSTRLELWGQRRDKCFAWVIALFVFSRQERDAAGEGGEDACQNPAMAASADRAHPRDHVDAVVVGCERVGAIHS